MFVQKEVIDFDPTPNLLAWEEVVQSGRAGKIREELFSFLSSNHRVIGWTGTEIFKNLGVSVLSVRPRLTELYKAGRVVRFKRPNEINNVVEYAYKII